MNRPLLLAKFAVAVGACATIVACSQAAASKKSGGGDDDTGDDFGGTDDPTLPAPRNPDYSNDDSGAFSPGGRHATGDPDGGRSVVTEVDAGPTQLAACTDGIQPGDVKIVEIMISAAAGAGDHGEWVELQSTRTDCILDVSGLTISSPRGTTSTDAATVTGTLTLNPGDSFLVADSTSVVTNHDLPLPLYSWDNSDVLKNDGDEIDVTMAGVTIDTLTYPSFSNLVAGSSVSFPSDCEWTDRPDWSRWSYSFDTYSGTLTGTPNLPNDDVTCF